MAKKAKKNEMRETYIAFAIFLVIVAILVAIIVIGRAKNTEKPVRETMNTDFLEVAPESPFEIENFEPVAGCPLGKLNGNLSLTCVGRYNNTLAVIVENIGTEFVQSAEVKINYGGMDAFFPIENLPAGGSILSLESQDMLYGGEGTEFKTPLLLGYTPADETVKTSYSADFDIKVENGILTIKNCSGRDFMQPVEIDCKPLLQEGLYFGSTVPLATEGVFANGESRCFDFTDGTQIVCLRYTE